MFSKHSILILLFISLLSTHSFAQDQEQKEFKPIKGDMGVVFNVAGLINNISVNAPQDPLGNSLLLFRDHIADKHVVRIGLGIQSYNNTISGVDSIGSIQRTLDSNYKKFNFYLSPGYEYHLKGMNRLDPYLGAGINLGLLGKTQTNVNEELKDTTGVNKTEISYQKEGGFMFGINAIIGFNYFLAPSLAVGAEYTLGFYSAREGGDWERVTVIDPVSGNNTSQREVGTERSLLTGFDSSNNLSITLSYYFGRSGS